jgi:5'-nucleotidase (lipoprotein e(P4) family)
MRALTFVLALTALACGTTRPADCNPGDTILNATLWMQSAAEYQASALQTYAVARKALDVALADSAASSLPPAVILDLDETALDNSPYAGRSVRAGKTFVFDDDWETWVAESAAAAVPGAKEFLDYAKSRGVTPFYITNRGTNEQAATRVNLEKLGFALTDDTLLVRGARPEWNTFDKTPRRDYVASRYRVLLLLGDDLNDFIAASGKSVAEREAIIQSTRDQWGTRWFVLPNAIYGSWEGAVGGSGGTPCEQVRRKLDAVETE